MKKIDQTLTYNWWCTTCFHFYTYNSGMMKCMTEVYIIFERWKEIYYRLMGIRKKEIQMNAMNFVPKFIFINFGVCMHIMVVVVDTQQLPRSKAP